MTVSLEFLQEAHHSSIELHYEIHLAVASEGLTGLNGLNLSICGKCGEACDMMFEIAVQMRAVAF